ncbi:MAG: hypothetical protein IT334_08800 [Thermomicrobiales bacterium]|nr:hypothetical protein [Thermomicrobiales bacterium]
MRRRIGLLAILVFCLMSLLTASANAQPVEPETWEAESFPVSVTYDRALWGGRSTSSFEGNERMQITARATVFTLQLFEREGMDAAACLEGYLDSIARVDGVSDFAEDEERDYPDGIRGAEDILVSYDFLWPGRSEAVGMVQYLTCQEIEPGRLMLIGVETRAGIYDEEIEIIDGILSGVTVDA